MLACHLKDYYSLDGCLTAWYASSLVIGLIKTLYNELYEQFHFYVINAKG